MTSDTLKNIHRRTGFRRKMIIGLFIASGLVIIALLGGLRYYSAIFAANVDTGSKPQAEICIPSGSSFDELLAILRFSDVVTNIDQFIQVAQLKHLPQNVKGGRYILTNGMSSNALVNMLRSGAQTPVNVTFNSVRTFEDLAGNLARRLEPDSVQFLRTLHDTLISQKYGFEPHTLMAMLIPNTYSMYWTATPESFMQRMKQEYDRFWNTARLNKAEEAGLSPLEVSILASIVDEETVKNDEKPRVAGLYINRLKRGIRLQADPTIKFAIGNFAVNRVLTRDLKINSPYNTYIHAGLPPGPVRMSSIQGIDAVLNYEKHDYLFMCAKADFSGYHDFARTLAQHNRNAVRYRRELKNRGIYR